MTVRVVSTNLTAIPDALLVQAKQHLRVEGSYDDEFIKSVIARAVARFENVNEMTLNETSVEWKPASAEFCNGAADVPARPVSVFTASAGEPPANVSANYSVRLKWNGIHGVPIQELAGDYASGLVVTLTVGAVAAALPPGVLDVILRHTAHLYEHREILIPGQEYLAPDLSLDASYWMPRV